MEQVGIVPCIMKTTNSLQFYADDLCVFKSNPLLKGTVSVSLVNS